MPLRGGLTTPYTYTYAAGETVRAEANTEQQTSEGNPTKLKEISTDVSATITVVFDHKSGTSAVTKAQIYKNGVAYGTEHEATSSTWVTDISEDLAFVAGDLIQIYAWKVGLTSSRVQNFKIKAKATTTPEPFTVIID